MESLPNAGAKVLTLIVFEKKKELREV